MRAGDVGNVSADAATVATVEQVVEHPGEGLEFELIRMKKECVGISRRLRLAEASGHLEEEAVLHRILDQKRETLRKLAKDEPGVAAAAGDVVSSATIVSYCAQIKSIVNSLAGRVATVLPRDLQPDLRANVQREVDSILELCAALTFQNV